MGFRAAALALVLCLGLGLSGARAADGGSAPDAADRALIERTIRAQMAAFQREDGDAAFGHAAPEIHAKFGTAELFMRLVREHYRPVYRPRSVQFRDLLVIDGVPAQEVSVVGPDGRPYLALYLMERQPDGAWKIRGCLIRPDEGSAT